MYPILGRYGPFFLYSFTLVMGLAIAAGIGLTAWKARRTGEVGWLDGFITSLLFGLVGSRIAFVIAKWEYFQQQPSEAWQIWRGGLNYHGALFAGILGLWAWCRWQERPFAACATLFAPGLAVASAVAWFACWLDGCAYGRLAPPGILSGDLPDSFGIFDVRYQTQLLGMGLSIVPALLTLWLQRRKANIQLFWFTLFGLSIGRMMVTLLRGDDVPLLDQMRMDTVVDGAVAVVSLCLLQFRSRGFSGDGTPTALSA
jgi:phosphatidylglycerol:prolipoprotein diacylglycerol transferase